MPDSEGTPPLIVLDCDSTAIREEAIELLADATGTRAEMRAMTSAAMRGEVDFVSSLRERVALLAGAPRSVFEQVAARITLSPGLTELIAEVHARGGKVGIVSGGFHEIIDGLAERNGVDFWRANRLEVVDGKLTGRLVGPIIDPRAKAEALSEWADESGIPLSSSVAIGDGANDLEMMEIAGLSVGYNAKPVVIARADVSITDLARVIPMLNDLSRLGAGA